MTAPLLGGALIGLAAVWLMAANGRIAGISGILGGLLPPFAPDRAWRVAFIAGLLLGPLLVAAVTDVRPAIGAPTATVPVAILAGLLVGLGTGLGAGCTSGHGVCGLARLSPRSLAATATFMAVAVLIVLVRRHVL